MSTGISSSCGATGVGLCYSRARIRWCYSPPWPFSATNNVIEGRVISGMINAGIKFEDLSDSIVGILKTRGTAKSFRAILLKEIDQDK